MKGLFPMPLQLVGKVMDLQLERQNIVMSNMANVDTPHYKAKRLEFEEDLQSALGLELRGKLSLTENGHIPSTFDPKKFSGDVSSIWRPHVLLGEDRVDLDKEMAKMAKNSMMYNALTTVIKKNYEGLKNAIMEGQK